MLQKCDGLRPICTPCGRARRADDCEYVPSQGTSTVQILEEDIRLLEARIQELQAVKGVPSDDATPALRLHQPYPDTSKKSADATPESVSGPPSDSGQQEHLPTRARSRRTSLRPTPSEPPRPVAEALYVSSQFNPIINDADAYVGFQTLKF